MNGWARRARQALTRLRTSEGLAARFARGSAWSILVNVAGAAVSFGTQVGVARALGAAQYGTYAYLLGWMNWLALIARFQLDGCALRFVSQYRATGRESLLRGFVYFSHRVVFAVSAALGLAAIAAVKYGNVLGSEDHAAAFAAAALLVPSSLILLTSSCIQGLQRMVASQAASLVLRPALLAVGVGALWWLRPDVSAADAIWVNAGATVVALAITGYYLWRATGQPSGPHPAAMTTETRSWLATALGFLWVTVAQQVLSAQTDILVVGSMRSKQEAGVYGAATQLAALVQFGVQAISIMGAPVIAQLHAQHRLDELARLMKHYGRLSLLVSLPVILVLVVVGRRLLGLYGPDFEAAYAVLVVLSLSQVVAAGIGTQAGYLLTMTGRERQAGAVVGICAVVNITLSVVLTARVGIVGTAAATLISGLLRAFLLEGMVRRAFGFSPLPV